MGNEVWPPKTADGHFGTTQWTMIAHAAREGDTISERALADLCERYWPPVYAFIRRSGQAPEASKDLTQGFFKYMLDKKPFAAADRAKGKFRTFLLTSVKFYLSRERRKALAQKRGGGALFLSIDVIEAEGLIADALTQTSTPETLFERQWIRTVMKSAAGVLLEEYARRGKEELGRELLPFVFDDGSESCSIPELASAKGLSEPALRMTTSRMRKRYAQILRDKIAQTVSSEDEIDAEVRHLFDVLKSLR